MKTEFKRELIFEDKKLLEVLLDDMAEFRMALEEVKKNYEKLELGKFTNETFQELKEIGTKEIEKKYNLFIDKQIEKMNITTSLMKASIKKQHSVLIYYLSESMKEWQNCFNKELYLT